MPTSYKGNIYVFRILKATFLFQTFVPSCEACSSRINGVNDTLAWEDTIADWVAGLSGDWFCSSQPDPEQCAEAISFLIPLALPVLVSQPRDWVDTFCTRLARLQ